MTADENHHGHSYPLAPLLCPRAPRRLPRHLHRAKPAGTLRSVVIATVFNLGSRSPPTSIRRRQAVPEQAEPLFVITMSFAVVSP